MENIDGNIPKGGERPHKPPLCKGRWHTNV